MEIVGDLKDVAVVQGAMDEGVGGVLLGEDVEGGDLGAADVVNLVVDADPLLHVASNDSKPGYGRKRS